VLETPCELIDRDHEHEVEEELEPRGRTLPFLVGSDPWRLEQRPLGWAMRARRALGRWPICDAHCTSLRRKGHASRNGSHARTQLGCLATADELYFEQL
jgi:hypothetical protein